MKHGSPGATAWRAMALQAVALTAALGASTARAAPEEIQVYMNEMDAPGEFGLDLHNNFVRSGSSSLEYPGAQQSLHRYRLTPEFSYGLTPSIDPWNATCKTIVGSRFGKWTLAADTTVRHFELDIGLDRGSGGSQDDWVIKAIIGVPRR